MAADLSKGETPPSLGPWGPRPSTFVANNGGAFAPGVADLFCRGGKQDDLADALLLVMYYLDTYSNQLST